MVRKGELKEKIVIGRENIDRGQVEQKKREKEEMKDGQDEV